ncbi:APC family permease [Microbacterium dextranolyticum]|uniref:Amino acid permease n=1 Tax=Microbacterium dextranolyticum TaxID=36806 RepID=A0A9W6M5J7_9MICO|nr:APC family permease [Microbacterium dextranolyticum]MBM7462313.1 amino acid transporter [Microbacterium dextranolyticum]GLJ94563.1 amino acid permease [Microbacterium dextranolyticum]
MTALERAIHDPAPVRAFGRRSPLEGLDRQSVGFVDVMAQSVSAVAPAAAATTVTGLVAGVSAGAVVVSVLVAGVLSLLMAGTVGQFARRLAASGALYTYAARSFGPRGGLATGAAVLVGYGAIAMFALLGGAHYTRLLLRPITPEIDTPLGIGAIVLAESALLTIVLVRGIRLSARVALVVELASVALIAALLTLLLTRIGPIDPASLLPSGSDSALGVAAGALIALTAYVGFESATTLGVEARAPLRTIPRAIRATVIVSLVLYLLAAVTQVAGFAGLGRDLSRSASPVNDLANAFGLGGWAVLADAGIAASFLACAIGSTTALARVLFAMGRDGVLGATVGRTHARYGTPIGAISVSLPIVVAVPLTLAVTGVDLRAAMHLTLAIGGVGYIVSYALVCLAAPVFLRRIGESTQAAVVMSWVAAIALLAAVVAFAAADVSSGSPAMAVAIAIAVVAAIAIAWRLRRPLGTLGAYDVPVADAVLGGVARDDPDG